MESRVALLQRILVLGTLVVACAVSGAAQVTSSRSTAPAESSLPLPYRYQVSFSYAHFSTDLANARTFNGATASFARGVLPGMQWVGEVGHYRGPGGTLSSLLSGPRIFLNFARFQPFVQALGGISHGSAVGTPWSLSAGGGLDVRAGDHLVVRAIEADFYGMHATPDIIHGSEQLRLGFGVSYQFGEW